MENINILTVPSTEFTLINYPLIIKNEEKALKSLGGLETILELLRRNMYQSNKRISLYLRPDMIYSKPLIGECVKTHGVLVKIKQLRNRKTGEIKIIPEILGKVNNIYEFNILCDYQFNPHESVTNSQTCNVFYDKIMLNKPILNMNEFENFMYSNVTMFLPPVIFTKNERPVELKFLNNSSDKPQPSTVCEISMKTEVIDDSIKIVEEMFRDRPMWTANQMKHVIAEKGLTLNKFIKIRSDFANYMESGPWKRTWSEKSYQYKTEPESRKFQVVEFRGNPSHIDFLKRIICQSEFRLKSEFVIKENNWFINETNMPTQINIFYSLCNIDIPEVTDFVKNAPFPLEPHEKFGWFTSDIESEIRKLIQNFVSKQVEFIKKSLIS